MVDIRKPRSGSLAFKPRKRASRQLPRVKAWKEVNKAKLLGFVGYKAGMIKISYPSTDRLYKGKEVIKAATVIEVPPIVVYGIRAYKDKKSIGDELTENPEILKRLRIKKPSSFKVPEDADDIKALVFAQPYKTGIGKKRIERMEIGVGGSSLSEKLEYLRSIIGKEINADEIFEVGKYVDIIAVTKGKGWQGEVKRHGVSLQRKKATGKRRHIGTLGQWHPPYVLYTVPRAGQMGYHKRTELNKVVCGFDEEQREFPHYGKTMNKLMVLLGSVPGPVKRAIRIRDAVRKDNAKFSISDIIW